MRVDSQFEKFNKTLRNKLMIKNMDPPGIEPGAFRLQSERDTTTPQTQLNINQ